MRWGEGACKLAVKLNKKNNNLRSLQLAFDTALLIMPYGKDYIMLILKNCLHLLQYRSN